MATFTIKYGRKVQVRPYEMLNIELTHEFDTQLSGHDEGFFYVRDTVNKWIDHEKNRLGAS